MPDIWIQLENHYWDVCPWRFDRMTGQSVAAAPVPRVIISPETNISQTRQMWKPMPSEALILRRYTGNWAAPDDRKLNPWDLNEPDPTDAFGTMGTIPGAVIECRLGEAVTVHFRNKDSRAGKPIEARTHSLHPHGFVFEPRFDGAYPLSPPDPNQPVGPEAALWAALGVTGFKRGDRVPPGGTFIYTWQTIGWQTTAGVWLYHDHSICDTENVRSGAIGIIVIHNPADPEDIEVTAADLPGGDVNGSPIVRFCFPFDPPVGVLPHDLINLGQIAPTGQPPRPPGDFGVMLPMPPAAGGMPGMAGMAAMTSMASATKAPALAPTRTTGLEGMEVHPFERGKGKDAPSSRTAPAKVPADPVLARSIQVGDTILELNPDLTKFIRFCFRFYRTPPAQAQYLLLFHDLDGVGMCINGRKYMGNTPTVVSGPQTNMRLGVVGMGNVDSFHTFHLHGHRWTLNGPHGTNRQQIQSSVQDTPVSQFEDTRTFGPATSFAFTIKEGSLGPLPSFMGPPPGAAVGEWHMHCHVLNHMMDGMMGSLLVINGGEFATALPVGVACPPAGPGGPPPGIVHTVLLHTLPGAMVPDFDPKNITVAVGDSIHWQWDDTLPHSTTSDTGVWDSGVKTAPPPQSFDRAFMAPGVFPYHCAIHGATGGIGMSGTVTVI